MQATALGLLVGFAAAVAPAQTYIVDINNGPGTNFTSLDAAATAAPDGAVLIVRAGNYPGMTILGKGLKVLAEPGVVVFGAQVFASAISVGYVPAGKSVVLRGMTIAAGFPGWTGRVAVGNCQGTVLMENLQVNATNFARLDLQQSSGVLVSNLQRNSGSLSVNVVQSQVAIENSTIGSTSGSAIVITGGTLQLRDCVAAGGLFTAPANAIEMHGGDVRILGATALQAGLATTAQACVGGTGTVRYEPSVTFSGGAPFDPGIVATAQVMPAMRATLASGQVVAQLRGVPGTIGVIAIGLVGQPVVIPGIQDALWLDSGSTFLLSFGVFGPSAPILSHTMPWSGGLVPGVRAVFQGVELDAAGALELSNPSLLILP